MADMPPPERATALAAQLARELLQEWYEHWRLDPDAIPVDTYLETVGDRVRVVVVGRLVPIPGREPFIGQRCVP